MKRRNQLVFVILLLKLCLPALAQGFVFGDDCDVKNLFFYDSKNAVLYRKNLSSFYSFKDFTVYSKLNLHILNSNLEQAGINDTGCKGEIGLGYRNFFAGISAETDNTPKISGDTGNFSFYNNNLKEWGLGAKAAYRNPDNIFAVQTSFSFDTLKCSDGDLYYFKGNVTVPYDLRAGLKVNFFNQTVKGFYGLAQGHIMNNCEEETLFNIRADYWYAAWNGKSEIQKWTFGYSLGYAGGSLKAGGLLTSENQHYFLFPYLYDKIILNGQLHLISARFNAEYSINRHAVLETGIDDYYCLNSLLDSEQNYRKKTNEALKLDGSEGSESSHSDLISCCDLMIPYITFKAESETEKSKISVFVIKRFYIPFLSESLRESDSGKAVFDISRMSFAEYLLSGFSIGINIELL